MNDLYFSSNPADYAKLEGLYLNERNPPGFITGADLSLVGIAGKCVRGPLTPTLVTGGGQFRSIFGGRDRTANGTGGTRIGEVHAALLNKKFGPVVVRRVAASDAVKASFTDETAAAGGGTAVIRVDASSVGVWGNDIAYKIAAATDGDANHFNLTVRYLGAETLYQNLDCTTGNDNLAAAVGTEPDRIVDLVKVGDGRPVNTTASTDGADSSGWIALGQTGVSAFTGVAGSEGTLAVTDFTAAMTDLAVYTGIAVCLTVGAVTGTYATYQSHLVTLAATATDRLFLTWAGTHGQSRATEVAQVASQITTRSDRILWCYNSPYTIDPDTATELQQAPHAWMASILSQIPASVHPGASETRALLAGIKRLTNTALLRDDLIALRAAGVCTLEQGDDGFQFRSAVTTLLTAGKTEVTRRRMADYLQLGAAKRLRTYVKAKNTVITRAGFAGELAAFSLDEQDPETGTIESFLIDQVSVNNDTQRGQGIEKILWRVRLIGHILALVFETEIGANVIITQVE